MNIPAMSAREVAEYQRLRFRFLTSAGNVVNYPVPAHATSVTVTWPRSEVNQTYGVAVTPSWNTKIHVVNKTATSCEVHFNPAPPVDATLDLITFRSE